MGSWAVGTINVDDNFKTFPVNEQQCRTVNENKCSTVTEEECDTGNFRLSF